MLLEEIILWGGGYLSNAKNSMGFFLEGEELIQIRGNISSIVLFFSFLFLFVLTRFIMRRRRDRKENRE